MLLGIPDEALGVHALEDATQDLVAVVVNHGIAVEVALVVFAFSQSGVDHLAGVDDLAALGDTGHEAGLREVGDIGRAAALDAHVDPVSNSLEPSYGS